MVITHANIIGTIIPTITGGTLTIMAITATHTSITATLVALGSALVFNSTNQNSKILAAETKKIGFPQAREVLRACLKSLMPERGG